MSTLLALNQTGEKLALSQCVNFYQINSLGYDSIVPIDLFHQRDHFLLLIFLLIGLLAISYPAADESIANLFPLLYLVFI